MTVALWDHLELNMYLQPWILHIFIDLGHQTRSRLHSRERGWLMKNKYKRTAFVVSKNWCQFSVASHPSNKLPMSQIIHMRCLVWPMLARYDSITSTQSVLICFGLGRLTLTSAWNMWSHTNPCPYCSVQIWWTFSYSSLVLNKQDKPKT